ncbi:hypothetical protein AYO38_09395 [bacterium SCGC AG-212-C10]|nr:hypothetical protein AYO38_09395 [bacterium SCGC AG-212-C10]
MSDLPGRVHLVAGGFPPGSPAGHDHDYARFRILEMLQEDSIPASVSSDFVDVERWLPLSKLMITYTAGPVLDARQAGLVNDWLLSGGRWLALHGTSGGKAARVEGSRQRVMVKLPHHETMGGFFINHPPVRKFRVDLADSKHPLTKGLPDSFEVIDEPYMVEVLDLDRSEVFLTSELGPDASPPGFGFAYEKDTALLPDGKTRVIAYSKEVGKGAVAYTTLGHCHSPSTNSQPFVDANVAADGKTPALMRTTWEVPAYGQLLRNGISWGIGS